MLPQLLFISIYMEYHFHSPHFVCISLNMMGVPSRKYIYGYFFNPFNHSVSLIHSTALCVLIREFSPFTFKVIIDCYVLIIILFIVFWLFWSSSLLLLLFFSFLVAWWLSLVFDSFLIFLCESTTNFCFVATGRFTYIIQLYI